MPPTTPCPDIPSLQQLLRGQLPLPDGEPLYDHLGECDRCAEYARTFRTEDVLSAVVRGAAAADHPEDPSVAGLIADLTRRGPPEGPDDLKATALSDTLPPFGDANDTGRELLDFLAPASEPDELGRLGPYRILKVLGSGGMGVVFHAEDPALQRLVAVKAMLPRMAASASARLRFLREGRAAASLHHDHIVPIYQVGEERGVPFLTMPLLRGESLEERLTREGALPPAEVCRIGREIAEGLAAAHGRGLVHRDVKPANVWLESDGEGITTNGRVKILDFGLARPVAEARLTQEGAILGTPAYMAPEQAGGRAVDARTDLFSLGCVLYHMATGELPFCGTDAVATLLAVANERPRPPAEVNPGVPPALSALVMRLLAKDPADRPASAREVVETVGQAGTVAAPPRGRGHWRRWALRALIAFLVLGAAAATVSRVVVPTDPPPKVEKAPPSVILGTATDFREIHGAEEKAFVAWADGQAKDGFRVASLSVRAGDPRPRFNGIAVGYRGPLSTSVRVGMTYKDGLNHFYAMRGRGYRPLVGSIYCDAGEQKQAQIWVNDGVTFGGYGIHLDALSSFLGKEGRSKGMMPVSLSTESQTHVPDNTVVLLAPDRGLKWDAGANQTSDDVRKLEGECRTRGWRLTQVAAYIDGETERFLTVAVENPNQIEWQCRVDLTEAEYERTLKEFDGQGLRPVSVASYLQHDESLYTALWEGYRAAGGNPPP